MIDSSLRNLTYGCIITSGLNQAQYPFNGLHQRLLALWLGAKLNHYVPGSLPKMAAGPIQ